jgi:hypothetical protein
VVVLEDEVQLEVLRDFEHIERFAIVKVDIGDGRLAASSEDAVGD